MALLSCGLLMSLAVGQMPMPVTEYPEYPDFQNYSTWLNAAHQPGFTFLKGAQQHGFHVAVFSVGENKIAICHHDLWTDYDPSKDNVVDGRMLDIRDVKGKELMDIGKNIRYIKKTYSIKRGESQSTFIEVFGRVYSLLPDSPSRIRVKFQKQFKGEQEYHTVFDEIIIRREGKEPGLIGSKKSGESPNK